MHGAHIAKWKYHFFRKLNIFNFYEIASNLRHFLYKKICFLRMKYFESRKIISKNINNGLYIVFRESDKK